LDLGLVMGSSEVHAAPSAAPPQPAWAKHPQHLLGLLQHYLLKSGRQRLERRVG
jgi:hypothetical protein